MKKYLEFLPAALVVLAMTGAVVSAQESTPAPAAPAAEAPAAAPAVALTDVEKNAPFTGSFFFTRDQIADVKKAQAGRPPVTADNGDISGALEQLIPPHRVISLSGVFYRSPKDWVVWVNGEKVTPKKLMPEIVDISVEKNSKVHLKWYDEGLKSTLSITMRPHQTYDIGAGVLLPGTGDN